ncbi:MAG TPA: ribosome recycling factor [Candidatus Paceibacterota bacterium]|nr:ribosome recycling factor [Candidatus Paceibacterota bacterium]
MAYDFNPLKNKVKETEGWLSKEFSGIRTGRATPVLLDSLQVEAYGSRTNITSLASVTIEDPRTLRITPWDMSVAKDIEKAIVTSNLGVSAASDDKGLRVSFPELTTERRTTLNKVVNEKAEEARIRLRQERDKTWKDLQQKEKDGTISEDERTRLKGEMEKIIQEASKKIDEQASKKEKEIMS